MEHIRNGDIAFIIIVLYVAQCVWFFDLIKDKIRDAFSARAVEEAELLKRVDDLEYDVRALKYQLEKLRDKFSAITVK
jgi:hypothetical protein